jgi:hypothetical protein
MELMNTSTARTALFRLLDTWRAAPGQPVYIGAYGSPEAVLTPLAVWHRMQALIADAWDAQTAAVRVTRLEDPAGSHPADLTELARVAGCAAPPVPVLQSRGVPRGGAALAAWPGALDDLRKLAALQHEHTPSAALRMLSLVLLGKAVQTESRCGYGTAYSVADVDGLHVTVLTTRRLTRPAGRRGGGGYDTVELVAVDHIAW